MRESKGLKVAAWVPVVLLAGCGGRAGTVSGVVKVNGVPAKAGGVTFHPAAAGGTTAVGAIGEGGREGAAERAANVVRGIL